MKWAVFSLSQMPDQSRRVEAFDEDLDYFVKAEELGYDTVWLAEHLFSTYGVVTSTQVYAAAVAQRTKRIKIGTAVVAIPFNHPLRTASDFALIDILSHGRLLFGVGRAYQPHEFVGLGVPMAEAREMMNEGVDIVLDAWTNETVSRPDGRHWPIPDPVECLPKPVQQPHPPVYQASISPESFTQAAEKGYHLQLASPFTYRTYREVWVEKLQENLAVYESACEANGRDPKAAERMMLMPYFCHEDGARAREIFGERVQWFYNKVASNQLSQTGTFQPVRGYELTMTEGLKTRELGYLNFEKLHEFGACIAGDPEECIARLRELRDRLGITEFALWSTLGGLPIEHVESSMRITMEKVIPHV